MANFGRHSDDIINKVTVDDKFRSLFEKMLKEVIEEDRFDTLVSFVDLYMMGTIRYWCSADAFFNHPDHVDEIADLVRIKLMKKIVTGFIRKGENGVNNDPEGFKKWMFTVAKNTARDYFAYERNISKHQKELPDTEWNVDHDDDISDGITDGDGTDGDDISTTEDIFISDEAEEARRVLNQAFRIVMEGSSNVYIILTWVTSFLYMQVYYKSRIEASRYIREFGDKTLNELYEVVLELSKDVPWLVIDDDMKANVEKKLAAVSDIDDSRTYGECRFKEFYGENATARVSDWINKRNQRIINILRKKKDPSDNENGDDKR